MKYFQSWQDFMRDPANKSLKESKGIHACKQKFIQEQNRQQWYDPIIITEAAQDAGFEIVSVIPAKTFPSDVYTGTIKRDKLAQKFRNLSEEDFTTTSAHILARK